MTGVLINSIRGLLSPTGPRDPDQIESDVLDEFAFHIEQLEMALIERGAPPEAAKREARQKFGMWSACAGSAAALQWRIESCCRK